MVERSSGRLKRAFKIAVLVAVFTVALWIESSILLSYVRFEICASDHHVLLEVCHVLALASRVALARAFPGRTDQARLTLIVAFGGPVIAWVAARGWAPSYVGINVSPLQVYWEILHCVIAAAFLLVALVLRGRGNRASLHVPRPARGGLSVTTVRRERAE